MPASHHSVFYRPDALPATQPTVSKHCKALTNSSQYLQLTCPGKELWGKWYIHVQVFYELGTLPVTQLRLSNHFRMPENLPYSEEIITLKYACQF